jgi:hypothetical protein
MARRIHDADDQGVKYKKRRFFLQRHRRVVAYSGLFLVVSCLVSLLHYAKIVLDVREAEELSFRRLRAAEILKQVFMSSASQDKFAVSSSEGESNEHGGHSPSVLKAATTVSKDILKGILKEIDLDIRGNVHGGIQWARHTFLPPLPHVSFLLLRST